MDPHNTYRSNCTNYYKIVSKSPVPIPQKISEANLPHLVLSLLWSLYILSRWPLLWPATWSSPRVCSQIISAGTSFSLVCPGHVMVALVDDVLVLKERDGRFTYKVKYLLNVFLWRSSSSYQAHCSQLNVCHCIFPLWK